MSLKNFNKYLLEKEISAEHLYVLMCLQRKEFDFLEKYIDINNVDFDMTIQVLQMKDFVKLKNPSKGYELDNIKVLRYPIEKISPPSDTLPSEDVLAKEIVKTRDPEDLWEEFKNAYPTKDGERRLHTRVSITQSKYIKLLKNGLNHDKVMKALENEKYARARAKLKKEFFPSWKSLSVYVNQHAWEAYEDDIVDQNEDNIRPNERVF